MKILSSVFVLITLCSALRAQEFKAECALPAVPNDGFYGIMITTDMAAYSNESFSNIRIMNSKGKEVPFLLSTEPVSKTTQTFKSYQIKSTTIIDDSCTVIVIHNPAAASIRDISLRIKNAEISKELSLEGSDDEKIWYALKERFYISDISNQNDVSELRIVDFPLSNYKYYRLWINDAHSAPLNILSAGTYTYATEPVRYSRVPYRTFTYSDSSQVKRSYIKIAFDTLRMVDKISFKISGFPFFLRNATLYTEKISVNKKGKTERYLEYVTGLEINSTRENAVFLPGIKVDNLMLVVENEDNPALSFDGVEVNQLNRQLHTWLTVAEQYTLKFGEADLSAPVYDLAFFRDSIPDVLPLLATSDITEYKTTEAQSSRTFFTSRLFIWVTIFVVIIFLGFMSVRMVREANTADEVRK